MQSHMKRNIANVFTNRTTWFSRTSATRTDISIFDGKFFSPLRVCKQINVFKTITLWLLYSVPLMLPAVIMGDFSVI
jgi:hypothetical protein